MPADNAIHNDLLAALVEHSPNVVFAINEEGRVVFSNKVAREIFLRDGSFHGSEILGEAWESIYTELATHAEKRILTKIIGGRHFRLTVSCLPDKDIKVCYGTEITDLIRAQTDLHASEQFLRRVIDTDPNLIFVKDREGRFVLVNQAVADIYGSTIKGLVGKKDSDFNPNAEEVEHFRKDDLEVISALQEKIVLEEQVTNASGVARWFSTVKRPMQFGPEGNVHVLGVSTDVTEVRKLQGQLGQAQKMQALGQLAGGIAHDFNNLLTAILGHAEVIQVLRPHDPELIKSAQLIFNAGTRAQQLTGQLLGFARQGKNQHTIVDLEELIEETLILLRRTLDPTIVIKTKYAKGSNCILGDPAQIQQVIINLVLNARDAILTRNSQTGRGTIVFETSHDVSAVVLTVSDDGCGMSEEVQRRMFEPFFTTKEQGKGTGLGLAMVYGIVQNHSGDIAVHSEPAKGTSFTIKFSGTSEVLPKKIEPIPSFAQGDSEGHILVVDDNPDVRIAAELMLKSLGYKVTSCSSGEEALDILGVETNFDVALIDLMMPGIGGAETVKAIRLSGKDLPMVVTTGYGQNHAIQELMDSGVIFIKKPYELRDLQSTLNQAKKFSSKSAKC